MDAEEIAHIKSRPQWMIRSGMVCSTRCLTALDSWLVNENRTLVPHKGCPAKGMERGEARDGRRIIIEQRAERVTRLAEMCMSCSLDASPKRSNPHNFFHVSTPWKTASDT